MPKLWADSLDEHRALVLERLVDAYVSLVAEQGVEGLTVAAVAERAELARSAVYNHVDHLHDLALLHAEHTMASWLGPLQERAAAGASAWELLEDLVRNSLQVFAEDPLAGMDLASHLDDAQAARLSELLGPIREHLQQTVSRGVTDGEFVDLDPRALAGFVWACISGYRTMVGTMGMPHAVAADTLVPLLGRAVLAVPGDLT
ncbi:TetR/AcrR family transcriptional regulator [Salsipaludibacter albus]|uniref:TetR/AcrR family transcriptional regulator n=1 Tax=Salsipaludibacter albus TaxID=2849650 RepID=UPI001EE416DA|nr:TetR/AcrR family transcriptional regulator [Salsipaludibacter albus]MBY5162220.1 TetR/AcrR family transcriptional regulator [Salsipaludibacter albus]